VERLSVETVFSEPWDGHPVPECARTAPARPRIVGTQILTSHTCYDTII
jgi:hypothetical protein